jgi:dTDP-glucose pyrophosphorylase/predicted transcriptional regulator
MKDWHKTLIKADKSIHESIKIIDSGALQIVMVVNDQRELLGTVTDGDIRRGLLKGIALDNPVSEIMSQSPTTASSELANEQLITLMKKKNFSHIPIVDSLGIVVGLKVLIDLIKSKKKDNLVVLMAGGLGSRLGELTENCPKPLLKVGNKPILENILESLIEHGFYRFCISVNYKADIVEEYFGNGKQWGVNIDYLREDKKLGTAGALSLLSVVPDLPVVVMNGDILTKLSFTSLLEFHQSQKAMATMCVREYDFKVPYGVVGLDEHLIQSIVEKPVQNFFVNAGIYVLSPFTLEHIPFNIFFDMTDLFRTLIEKDLTAIAFPLREYWLDIGQKDDFKKANLDFQTST